MTTAEFPIVCVWVDAPLVDEPGAEPFSCLTLLNRFDFHTKYLALYKTRETKKTKSGRSDVFFAIHKNDIAKFSVSRFKLFSLETGFIYGIIYKNEQLSKQIEFFRQNGIPSFSITDEFAQFAIFGVKIFDLNNQPDDEEAEKQINLFMTAARKYEAEFPNCGSLKTLDAGIIRWWEDVVGNEAHDCYPESVLTDYPI